MKLAFALWLLALAAMGAAALVLISFDDAVYVLGPG